MEYVIGVAAATGVGLFASVIGFDKERSFYPGALTHAIQAVTNSTVAEQSEASVSVGHLIVAESRRGSAYDDSKDRGRHGAQAAGRFPESHRIQHRREEHLDRHHPIGAKRVDLLGHVGQERGD